MLRITTAKAVAKRRGLWGPAMRVGVTPVVVDLTVAEAKQVRHRGGESSPSRFGRRGVGAEADDSIALGDKLRHLQVASRLFFCDRLEDLREFAGTAAMTGSRDLKPGLRNQTRSRE